jgi:type IV secretion system protein VirD4
MNDLKNGILRFVAAVLFFCFSAYSAAAIFMYLAYGSQYLEIVNWGPDYFQRNYALATFFLEEMIYYINWMQENKTIVSFSANSYFAGKLFGSAFGVVVFSAILYSLIHSKLMEWSPYKEKEKTYGDAHWATDKDIARANLRAKSGILLGQDKSGYFIVDGYQHILLFAPTGSGKGVAFAIPNCLFWEESLIVHDTKLENYEKSSGWRSTKLGQKCYIWSPADPDGVTHCYNPLDWISNKPGQMVDDVQKMGNLILPQREFWSNEARSLFLGIVLYLLAVPEKVTSFGEVVRTLRSDDVVYNLAVALDTIGEFIHPVGYMNIAAFLQKPDKERGSVLSTLNSAVELWANPLIDTATASSDFNFQDMKKEKITVYVGVTPDNLKRLENLMQIFYQQATDFMTRKLPTKDEPYGVLFLMDEFPTIGKMEAFKAGIAFFRGYHVRLFLVIQDTQQLKGIYEEAGMNSFLSNSTYRITFAANNVETANLISQLCGNKTVDTFSQSKPKFLDFNPGSRSMNVSQAQRALLLPQEVLQLPKDEQIILIEAFPPIKSKKIKYYEDSFFKKRLLPPSPIPTQKPYEINSVISESDSKEEEVTNS